MWFLSSWKPLSVRCCRRRRLWASAYIDDIYINEDVMPVTHVREHLARFGLECKDPERLEDGTRVLGLAVAMEHGKLQWKQGSMVPDTPDIVMQWAVFSLCRRLVGHFPVCGWLGHKGLGWWDKGQLAAAYDIWDCGLCVVRRSNPWRLVCRWTGTERVSRCQLLSDRSSIGEIRIWGCLLAATWKRRLTY